MGFAAVLLGMLMAQLDGMVVTAALPRMGADLHAGGAVGGVTAAYLLAVAVATPLHGRLGDLLGRRTMFAVSAVVFVAGSLACAVAPAMAPLVAARALQGAGGGGLIVAAISALGEMFDRGALLRRQGWTTAVWGVSSLAGPPAGGLIAGTLGWHWIFLLNVPICAAALLLGLAGLPGRRERAGEAGGVDLAGAALIAAAGISVVLLGSSPALATSPVWAPSLAVVALGSGLVFVAVERRVAAPLISPGLLAARGVGRAVLATALTGIAGFGTFTYVPLVIVAGTGGGPTETGLLLLAATGGQLVASASFAALARRYPRLATWGRIGIAIGAAGLAVLALVAAAPVGGARVAMLVTGLAASGASLGLTMAAYTVIGQTAAAPTEMGATMATLSFARQMGGSIGIAAFGWLALLAGGRYGLTAIFLAAAAVLLVALVGAPRPADDG